MKLIESLTAGYIKSIDFDLAIGSDTYAQTTILRHDPRCRVYYCFKNEDTREDGEDRCGNDTYIEICRSLAEIISSNDAQDEINIIYSLTMTTADNQKHVFNNSNAELSADNLKRIISTLAHHIDEFTFLPAFTPYL